MADTFVLKSRLECDGAGLLGCDPSTCYNILSNPDCPSDNTNSDVIGVICVSRSVSSPSSLPSRGFRCADNHTIIFNYQFCDGNLDCPDGSDEVRGQRGFQCRGSNSNETCLLPQLNLFDDEAHCSDGSDICKNRTTFRCLNEPSIIISRKQVCDGWESCWGGSDEYTPDEQERGFACPKNRNDPYFICLDKKKIINIHQVCDGRFDCFDRSDECDFEEQLKQENFSLRCAQIDQCRSIFSSESEMIENVWLRVTLWLVAVIVVIGNSCVIAFTSRKLKQVNLSNTSRCQQLIILNIAIADILMGLYLFSISANHVATSGKYTFVIDRYWRYSLLCHFAGVFAALSSETSCFLMVLLTTFRFFILTKPFESRGTTSVLRWKIAIVSAWFASFILAFVPVVWFYLATGAFTSERVDDFEVSLMNLTRDEALDLVESIPFYYSATSVCLPRFYSDTTSRMWPYTFAVITINFLSFCFIGVAYIFIYKKSSKQLMKSERTDQLSTRMQRRIARIIFTDCACWLPICILSYMALANVYLSDFAYIITAGLLLPINSALNPFLYSSLPDKIYEKACEVWRDAMKKEPKMGSNEFPLAKSIKTSETAS